MLKESDFLGEGHRKVRRPGLRAKGIGVGKNRVLRLMRENGLLSPRTARKASRVGTGATAAGSRRMCRTSCGVRDATTVLARRRMGGAGSSWRWITASQNVVGWHVAKKGDRWASARADPRRPFTNPHGRLRAPRSLWGSALQARLGPSVHRPSVPRRAGLASGSARQASYVGEFGFAYGVAELRFMRTLKRRVPVPPRRSRASRRPGRRSMRLNRTLQPRVYLERHGYRTPAQCPSGAHPEGGMIRPPTCPGNR